jgi:transposase
LGRSRGGFSSKIHALSTTKGKPLEVTLTPGQQGDSTEAEHLLQYAHGRAFMADAGYDSDAIVAAVKARGMKPVIAMNPTRKYHRRRRDTRLYRLRGEVECMFHRLKRFRAVASRYEKTATNYLAVVHLACMMLWLN